MLSPNSSLASASSFTAQDHLFPNPANLASFFALSVLPMTLGNLGLSLASCYIQENQYSSLIDHLDTHIYVAAICSNVLSFSFGLLLTLDCGGQLVCSLYSVLLKQCQFVLVFTHCLGTVLRLLYLTWWKNVGALNDSFFLSFARGLTILFSALYTCWLVVFRGQTGLPDFQVCMSDLGHDLTFDLVDLLVKCSAVIGLGLRVVLAMESGSLRDLHNNTRDGRGLPRTWDTHPSLQQLTMYTACAAVVVLAIGCYHFHPMFLKDGRLSQFPYSLTYFLVLWFPGIFVGLYFPGRGWLRARGGGNFARGSSETV